MKNEEWKIIDGYDGLYQVSNYGNIKSFKRKGGSYGKILKPIKNTKGYLWVRLCKNKISKGYLIARLVLLNFLPYKNSDILQVNHLDGIKTNNNLSNLQWCTSSENITHAYKTGLKDYKGESNPCAKLSEKDILEIRFLLKRNISQKNIAQKYGVHRTIISRIKSNKIWKHI